MPYIPAEERDDLDTHLEALANRIDDSEGRLVYSLFYLARKYARRCAGSAFRSFASYNSAIGALQCTLLEFYATQVIPYERSKRAINGDVAAPRRIPRPERKPDPPDLDW